jgi:hypothetical protein
MNQKTEGEGAKQPEPRTWPKSAEASISTARQMIANGQTRAAAADWLARNCPKAFKDAAEASEAIGAV